jgi:hypothetical protein
MGRRDRDPGRDRTGTSGGLGFSFPLVGGGSPLNPAHTHAATAATAARERSGVLLTATADGTGAGKGQMPVSSSALSVASSGALSTSGTTREKLPTTFIDEYVDLITGKVRPLPC